jgi:hypothetical protein
VTRSTFRSLLRRPGRFVPLAMTGVAFVLIGAAVARLIPLAATFAATWIPRAPRPALVVLALQTGTALLAILTIVCLEH